MRECRVIAILSTVREHFLVKLSRAACSVRRWVRVGIVVVPLTSCAVTDPTSARMGNDHQSAEQMLYRTASILTGGTGIRRATLASDSASTFADQTVLKYFGVTIAVDTGQATAGVFTADSAVMRMPGREVALFGHVVLIWNDQIRISTSRAVYRPADRVVMGVSGYAVDSAGVTRPGRGFTLFIDRPSRKVASKK